MSVVFDFNDSLNDAVPAYPIVFPVDEKRNESNKKCMGVFCVSFVFYSQK